MFSWMTTRDTGVVARPAASERSTHEAGSNVGQYQLLHKYLRDRYANRVVLTFNEIEDLLGFKLPDPARLQLEWWASGSDAVAYRSAQSDSWTLANRTATVNLLAQSVVFERRTARNGPTPVRPAASTAIDASLARASCAIQHTSR